MLVKYHTTLNDNIITVSEERTVKNLGIKKYSLLMGTLKSPCSYHLED
jgi:hypothetical protein